jgi:S-DNA-T family DNA segregation ATPase FtsK/SpoIIIE
VITADRSGLAGRLAAAATERIVLRLADPTDFTLLGLPGRDVPRELPPGRGVRASDLALVQVAAVGDDAAHAARRWPDPVRPARGFDPLPDRVTLTSVGCSPDLVVLGIGGDDLDRISLSRNEIGTSFVVAGPPRSGRTTALHLIASQLTGRRIAASCGPRSPLLDVPGVTWLPPDDQDHAVAIARSLHDADIIVDDVDRLAEGALWQWLTDRIGAGDAAEDFGSVVVMAGASDLLAAAFRGPAAQARRAKHGVLLTPGAHDGDLFGVRLPRADHRRDPPGRAWLAMRGAATPLQLALPNHREADSWQPRVC